MIARLALACLLLGLSATPMMAADRPHRISSLNLCTDELVMMLADPADIASLSPLARDPDVSIIAVRAAAFPSNRADAEIILRQHADLVVAETSAAGETIDLLRHVGVRVETLDFVDRLDRIAPATRQIGTWLGQSARAEALIDRMNRALAAIPQPAIRPTALIYHSNGWSSGAGTLSDDVLAAAGFVSQAARLGLAGYGTLALETVVAHPPDILISGRYRPDQASLAEQWLDHPALQRLAVRHIDLPSAWLMCGTPAIADAVAMLAAGNGARLGSPP